MSKSIKEFKIGEVPTPEKGQIEDFIIIEMKQGELQEFVDPEIIKKHFKGAKLTDGTINVTLDNKQWGQTQENFTVYENWIYRHKLAKVRNMYGEIKLGLKWKFQFDGKNWKIVLP